jgi:hypothetical protein
MCTHVRCVSGTSRDGACVEHVFAWQACVVYSLLMLRSLWLACACDGVMRTSCCVVQVFGVVSAYTEAGQTVPSGVYRSWACLDSTQKVSSRVELVVLRTALHASINVVALGVLWAAQPWRYLCFCHKQCKQCILLQLRSLLQCMGGC